MNLNQKKVVIFGGSSGIGLETARLAREHGAHVAIVSHDPGRLSAAKEKLDGGVATFVADTAREADVARVIDAIGEMDHIVYTSGDVVIQKALDEISVDEMHSHFVVRLFGAALVAKYAKGSIRAGGSISLTSSTLPIRPQPGFTIGTAVSGAVNAFGRALAREFAPVRVNVVAPGVIRTPLWDRVPEGPREAFFEDVGRRLPVGRVGNAADVAETFIYLMKAEFTNGQVIMTDGGVSVT